MHSSEILRTPSHLQAPDDLVLGLEEVAFIAADAGQLVCISRWFDDVSPPQYALGAQSIAVGVITLVEACLERKAAQVFVPFFGGLGLPLWFMQQVTEKLEELSEPPGITLREAIDAGMEIGRSIDP